jgi:hypothetical protein
MRRIRRVYLHIALGVLTLTCLVLTGLLLQKREATRSWGPARSARVGLEASDAAQTVDALEVLARQQGGSMVESSLRRLPVGGRRATATLCVPVTCFDEAVDGVRGTAKVVALSLETQDLASEITEREARVRNAQREEGEIAKALGRVDKLKDIVSLEKTLAAIRTRVDRHSEEVRAIRGQSELAVVAVDIREPRAGAIAAASVGGAAYHVSNAVAALAAVGDGLLALVVYVVLVGAIIWVPALAVWWFVVVRGRKRWPLAMPGRNPRGTGGPDRATGRGARGEWDEPGLEAPPAK